jgi:hypothetical protein
MTTQPERVATLEANYKNICDDLEEIKKGISDIKVNVNGLNQFKAKIIGIAAGISAVISILTALGFSLFK